MSSISNQDGVVTFPIPDDFPLLESSGRDRRSAEFTLSAETRDQGVIYQSRLHAEYRVDPGHRQSTGLGILVAGIGMVAGGLLGRSAAGSGR